MAFPPTPWTPVPNPPARGAKLWDIPLDAVLAALAATAEAAWENDVDISSALLQRGISPVHDVAEITHPTDGQLVYNLTTRVYLRWDSTASAWVTFSSGSGGGGSFITTFRGAWTATSYSQGDIVTRSGASWLATSSVTSTQIPGTDSAWAVIAAAGAAGATGATGPQGPAGATGPQGATGPAGSNGNGVLTGTGAPSNGLGSTGDLYYDTAAHTLYGPKASGVWPTPGVSLVGPAGATGPAGTNGYSILHGTTDPSSSDGQNNDFWFNTSTSTLWGPKASGTWPGSGTSLVGPTGATGATGSQGPAGATGPAGPGVAAGGTAGQWLKKLSSTDYDTGFAGITESDVAGLTSDLAGKVSTSLLGAASGVATLDSSSKLPTAQLPSGVVSSFASPGASAVGDITAAGSSASAARADHVHGREAFATAGSSAVGDSASAGTATTVSRSDHRHGRESFGTVTAQTSFGASSANGTATTPARSDHVHGTPSLLDHSARRIGLVAQPFPIEACNAMLGASSDYLILALIRPGATTISNLGVWMGNAGVTPSGVNAMALFDESGTQLGITGDMSTALSTSGNTNTYVEAALGSPVATTDATNYYVGILCHMSTVPQIALAYQSGAIPAFPSIKGHRPSLLVSGQTTMPASFSVSGATAANAAYWLVAS